MERYEIDFGKMVKFKYGNWVHWADVERRLKLIMECVEGGCSGDQQLIYEIKAIINGEREEG